MMSKHLLSTNAAGVAVHDFTLYRGDSFVLPVQLDLDGVPMDLSDYSVSALVKPSGGEPFAPICVVENDVVQMSFAHEHTKDATWKNGRYDIQIKKNQMVKTILCGKIVLMGDITP